MVPTPAGPVLPIHGRHHRYSDSRTPTPVVSRYSGLHSYPPVRRHGARRQLWVDETTDDDYFEEMLHNRRVKRALNRLATTPIAQRRRLDPDYL